MPALPLHTAGVYVAASYIVFLVLVVSYVAIMRRHVDRVRRELDRLTAERVERR